MAQLRLFVLILVLPGTPACLTARTAKGIHGDLVQLQARLDAVERLGDQRQQQIRELRQVLDQATALMTEGSADVGAKEAKAEVDIAALQARVDELSAKLESGAHQRAEAENRFETRMAALEQSEERVIDKVAPSIPDDKEQLWAQAGARLKAGQRETGRHFYRVFIQRFPDDPRAPQAYLALGQSLVEDKQFPKAAAEFQRLLDTYPRSPEVPTAMWRLADAFVQLRFCTDARSLLGDLVRRFPKSPPAAEAAKELRTMRKLPRAACTS
jgi:TolA-binding protein